MNVAIYGLGLIGGSLGRAVLAKTDDKVYGYDVDASAVLKAKMLGAISDVLTDEILPTCELVVLAVNPSVAIKIMKEITPRLTSGTTVTDCCGNKREIVAEMEKLHVSYPEIGFVAAHPMAGREFSGIEHSTTKLFERSFVVLTPVHSSIADFIKVKSFFTAVGCEGSALATSAEHDEIISYTSQLAHVVSSAFAKNPMSIKHAGFSAGSFRDLTRVAKLNPDMWTELFIGNADNLSERIGEIITSLTEYKDAISSKDTVRLRALLQDGVNAKQLAENAIRDKRKEKNE